MRWYQRFGQMKLYVMVETVSLETGASTPNNPLPLWLGARCLPLSTTLSLVKFSLKHLLQRLVLWKGDNLGSTECVPTQNVSSAKVVPSIYISFNPNRHKGIAWKNVPYSLREENDHQSFKDVCRSFRICEIRSLSSFPSASSSDNPAHNQPVETYALTKDIQLLLLINSLKNQKYRPASATPGRRHMSVLWNQWLSK